MIDLLSQKRAKEMHPLLIDDVEKILAESSAALERRDARGVLLAPRVMLRLAYTYRSNELQAELYAQGRTKPGPIVTWAGPGSSYHNYRMAFDIVLLIDVKGDGVYEKASWDTLKDYDFDGIADWMEVVKICEARGWEWGGRWRRGKTDMPHFQKTFGYTITQLKKMAAEKRYYPGTTIIKFNGKN